MKLKLKLILIICIIAFLAFPKVAMPSPSVLVEFLYYEVCQDCPEWEVYYKVYMHNSQVVDNIQRDYGSDVQINRIDWKSPEGREKRAFYNLSIMDWNSIIVNGEIILKGGDQFVNENYLRSIIDYYLALEHDVAVSDVSINCRSIQKGEILAINVTATNKGKQPESFNVSIYFNNTSLGTLLIDSLEPSSSKTLSFNLSTSDLAEGYHNVIVYATPVQKEINIADNSYYAGTVEIKTQGAFSTDIHDLSVASVIPSKSIVRNQEQINITVTIKNLGTVAEDFILKIFLNQVVIKEELYSIGPSDSIQYLLVLNASDLSAGNHTVKARVEFIKSDLKAEQNVANNELSCTIIVLQDSDEALNFFTVNVSLAFIFGFFETFSPCLIVLLSFILSYTAGEVKDFKDGFYKVMIFGVGFVFAALAISLMTILIFFSIPFQTILLWAICIFAILFGFNTIGFSISHLFKVKDKTKLLMQKLTKKYVKTYVGIMILGFLFYFLDPCIAPFFFAIAPLVLDVNFISIVIAFCLGVILPFVIIGIVAGSISKLARNLYKHRSKLRVASGLILICYSTYILIYHLFS